MYFLILFSVLLNDACTVTAATMAIYYIFLFSQSATGFIEYKKALQAYREKKIDEKPSIHKIKNDMDNANIRAATRL